jgi:hypothetical protein
LPTAISTVQSEYFTGDQNTTNAGHLSMQRSVNHGTRNAMNRILKMAITWQLQSGLSSVLVSHGKMGMNAPP